MVAEWMRDHSMASGPRRMSRTGKRVSLVWDMVRGRHPGPATGGTGMCPELLRGLRGDRLTPPKGGDRMPGAWDRQLIYY